MWLLNSLAQKSFPFLVIWRLLATGMVSNTYVRVVKREKGVVMHIERRQ